MVIAVVVIVADAVVIAVVISVPKPAVDVDPVRIVVVSDGIVVGMLEEVEVAASLPLPLVVAFLVVVFGRRGQRQAVDEYEFLTLMESTAGRIIFVKRKLC